LAENLDQILPKNAVVISSVDFSHHLNRVASKFHDQRSISAIKSFDYGRVLTSEIDSPASIYTLLRYLELRGIQKMAYKSVNSADFTGNILSDDVTSYLFAHFTRGGLAS
jgi:predicted class III extradiol MEMO1 family dioxygenase